MARDPIVDEVRRVREDLAAKYGDTGRVQSHNEVDGYLTGRLLWRRLGSMADAADPVVAWLLLGDPAIRWQVLQDLLGLTGTKVAKEQARVEREGWGAQLLGFQNPHGGWAGFYTPKWTSTTYTLLLLRALGLGRGNRAARIGTAVLLDQGLYPDNGINFWLPKRRSSETCVTGMVVGIAARFAPADDRIENLVEYLLAEQMVDGGWNCRRRLGAKHSSLHTTICALEGLLEYEAAGGKQTQATRRARELAHEFLFVHQLYRSHRTGKVIDDRMTRFSFPPHWHYDILRGLDYLAAAGAPRDSRASAAIELVGKRRARNGRWLLDNTHKGRYYFAMEQPGEASRWNTLRALRVLRWWDVDDR